MHISATCHHDTAHPARLLSSPDLNLVKHRRGRRLNFNSSLAEVQISRKKIRLNVRQKDGEEGETGRLAEGLRDRAMSHFTLNATRHARGLRNAIREGK